MSQSFTKAYLQTLCVSLCLSVSGLPISLKMWLSVGPPVSVGLGLSDVCMYVRMYVCIDVYICRYE